MSKLEVLCVTMHQKDYYKKFKEMNLQSDVVFANQTDSYNYEEGEINGYKVKMISTSQRGVGKNRNTALLHASGDICIFADDDVRYFDGYVEGILSAFEKVPEADILIFNISSSNSQRRQKQNDSVKRCRIWNVLGYGTFRIAFRLNKIKMANVWFTQLFGGGCIYPSGEDSLWLIESLKKGLKIYTYPLNIGIVNQEESTWFKGFDDEYFFGRGALIQAALPKVKYLMLIYYLIRFRKISMLSMTDMIKFIRAGMRAYKLSQSFSEWKITNAPTKSV